MKIEIRQIEHAEEKQIICRAILEALPEWFGIPEAREEYIRESADRLFFAAMDGEKPVGFLYLKETGRDTVELYAMGVLKAAGAMTGRRAGAVGAARARARRAMSSCGKTVQWENTPSMTRRTGFIWRWGSRSSRYSRTCGTNGTRVRCM